jgi:hypothetical protein
LIYDYFLSRVYDVDFVHASNTHDKEALFVPSGYDSLELINNSYSQMFTNEKYLHENGDEKSFQDVIPEPSSK